ncbi:hypothetical protein OIDMADRAFT_137323 [Oidiodendron maius Zn]|uniref:Zn(2)-C6 fungal-type domain-containing protein n=1 Tax=Oidiodendron maius (strain Zn) TaxID=913774 RepID=A0A0C3CVI2_OIDMZ|nr:hypothetical protein OIDMADRAFT_137323 [Oidiodendron maius Zn]
MITGRQRRKKCDELRPICINCSRNGFWCSWPKTTRIVETTSRQQLQDSISRSSSSKNLPHCIQDGRLATASSIPFSLSVSLFESDMQSYMFQYCTDLLLLSKERQPGPFYEGQSYTFSMGLHFTPLLDAIMACAAITLSSETDKFRDFAVSKYISSVQGVRTGLVDGSLVGVEDYLLATVMWLCVFENSRCDGTPKINHHVRAMSNLLRLRPPMDRTNSAASALAFERICVESFIYHSANIMVFSSKSDLVYAVQQLAKKFESCFTTGTLTRSYSNKLQHSFVLGATPDVFIALMQATKLARSAQPDTENSVNNLWRQNWQILHLEQQLNSDGLRQTWEGRLYMLATRMLVMTAIQARDGSASKFCAFEFHQGITEGLQIFRSHTFRAPFKNYYLLPLAILGSVLTSEDDVAVICDKLNIINEKCSSSTVKHIREILEDIWISQVGSTENFAIDGLGKLLRCANICGSTDYWW